MGESTLPQNPLKAVGGVMGVVVKVLEYHCSVMRHREIITIAAVITTIGIITSTLVAVTVTESSTTTAVESLTTLLSRPYLLSTHLPRSNHCCTILR